MTKENEQCDRCVGTGSYYSEQWGEQHCWDCAPPSHVVITSIVDGKIESVTKEIMSNVSKN